ncbi:MAG: hypothetical protein SFU25_00095 [Candidatus Caenarcaniphilales bacterium]|nr:hypothetical protein [Candidatus Caenarcaniphilales bacterium]
MKKFIYFCLVFTLSLPFLSSCTGSSERQTFTLRGAFFGSNDGQAVLLTNQKGSIQQLELIKNSEYIINIPKSEIEKGPFYLIYTFDQKPKINPQPPYIIAKIDVTCSLLLPAILVFPFKFKFLGEEYGKLSFEWLSPVFSQSNGSKLYLETSFEEGFPFAKTKRIIVDKLPFEAKSAEVDLNVKLKNQDRTLKERLAKNCKKSTWYISMPYHYPEGIDLIYASNSENPNLCD